MGDQAPGHQILVSCSCPVCLGFRRVASLVRDHHSDKEFGELATRLLRHCACELQDHSDRTKGDRSLAGDRVPHHSEDSHRGGDRREQEKPKESEEADRQARPEVKEATKQRKRSKSRRKSSRTTTKEKKERKDKKDKKD